MKKRQRIWLALKRLGFAVLVLACTLSIVRAVMAQEALANPVPHSMVDTSFCVSCHSEGRENAPIFPDDHVDYTGDECTECHLPSADAQPLSPYITHSLVARSDCLRCHERGIGGSPIMPSDHTDYTEDECRTCHHVEGEFDFLAAGTPTPTPIPVPPMVLHPQAIGENNCVACHNILSDEQAEIVAVWEKSIHAERGVGCEGCHGGDPNVDNFDRAKASTTGYVGVPDRVSAPAMCATCHSNPTRMRQYDLPTDQFAKYQESVHGRALYENGDTNVATCADCHGSHGTLAVTDPSAAVYPVNVPALCASCHTDEPLMAHYGIDTDQYDLYKGSVHGIALLQHENLRAPSCATCHGTHGAAPPGFEEVANVCGGCHSATQDYFLKSAHASAGIAGPRCVSCHGRYDVSKPDETMFLGTEDRHCGSCHPPDSEVGKQSVEFHDSIVAADVALEEAAELVEEVSRLGIIVAREEGKLLEARTGLITARAAQHEVVLENLTSLTDSSIAASEAAKEMAEEKLQDVEFRRQAMSIAVVIILITVLALYGVKRQLDRQLEE